VKFSLVMCSLGRIDEPVRFLESLCRQTEQNFELVVVDQNLDDRLTKALNPYRDRITMTVLHSARGLSHGRNVALAQVTGDVVAFPDDDCQYPSELLHGVRLTLERNISWAAIAVARANDFHDTSRARRPIRLSLRNLWGRTSSYTLFARKSVTNATGQFDEILGVGAGTPWGAGEDTDYVLRSLGRGHAWYYLPSLHVVHAPPVRSYDTDATDRARRYARGLGYVLRKRRVPLWMVFGGCALSVARVTAAAIRGDPAGARWHLNALQGRIEGWL
jgi:glycosyltransferase involved in cell wall biosynthesis